MSTQKRSMASLKSAFGGDDQQNQTQNQSFTNNYYPFWSMNVGQRAVVRFLPDKNENNPRGFLVEKVVHNLTINGQQRKIPCLSMYEQECPICKISQAYYKAKDDVNGKKYWKKKQYLGQAIIIEDPLPADENGETHEGKVRMIALGFQIYNVIKDAFSSDELEGVPYDFEEGYDFIIKKTEQGKYGAYNLGTKFANKQRSLTEDELVVAEEGMIDLSTLLPKNPGVEKVQAMLDAEMNGEEYRDGNIPSDDAPDEDSVKTSVKPAFKAPVETTKTTTHAETTDSDPTGNVADMLEKIKARRKQSAVV